MKYISNNHFKELLKNVPDLTEWNEAEKWMKAELEIIKNIQPQEISEVPFTCLSWKNLDIKENKNNTFGWYASDKWRKFVFATFLADLASYTTPADQVNFSRLLFVMNAYPQGFRTWWIQLSNSEWHPIGYTGWYPMLETMFEQFEKRPETLKDRLVAPALYMKDEQPYLYLFNYSVISPLKKSTLTKKLLEMLTSEIEAQKAAGLGCITVSEDGMRIAKQFKMGLTGYFEYEGCKEGVYTSPRL